MRRRAVLGRLAGLALLAAGLLLVPLPTSAAQIEITSNGPLTRIIISDELNCQVAHQADAAFELFPAGVATGACGTFLALGEELFGPSIVPAGVTPTQPWTPISQSPISGRGTAADPFHIVTVVAAGTSGVRIEQTDSYVVGSEGYRTDVRLVNDGAQPRSGILYRAGDCYLQEDDEGFGRVDGGAPACIADQGAGSRIEQWLPLTPGSSYIEGRFTEVWDHVARRQPFSNTCRCDERVDNGAGLSWPVSLGVGEATVISHETYFSPLGRTPATGTAAESFRESVPSPADITLDPITVVQSLLITAGVILLMPFPAALFNETFEANYDRITAGVARLRRGVVGALSVVLAAPRAFASAGRTRGPATASPPPAHGAAPLRPSDTGAGQPGRRWTAPGPDFWRTPQGILAFIVPSSVVYAFLDPTLGLSLEAVAMVAGLFVGLVVVVAAYGIPLLAYARVRGIAVVVKALPVTLLIGVACVLLSRFADFQPGYLYGLVIGALFAHHVDDDRQGPAEAVGAAALLVVAAVAWLSLLFIRDPAAGADLGYAAFETAAVTVAVAGVEGALFAMLPLRFMPGGSVLAWNRRVWALLIGIGVFGFFHVLLNPQAGYLADQTRTSFLSMLLVFVAFAAGSIAFWAYFRLRPTAPTHAPPPSVLT